MRDTGRLLILSLLLASIPACKSESSTSIAPEASSLAPAKPASAAAVVFAIDKGTSKIDFLMDAPKEKIHGKLPAAMEGDLNIDPKDITKTTGVIKVDIGGLELFQAFVDDDGKIGDEAKSDKQNEHARAWLEISPDAPEKERAANSMVQFSIQSIDNASTKDVSAPGGKDVKLTFMAKGELLLHGHKTMKDVEMEATFKYDDKGPTSVTVKTTKPFAIGLAEHDVKPREGFGKLAQKTLELLAPKVAKEAPINLEFTANAKGAAAAPAPGAAPDK